MNKSDERMVCPICMQQLKNIMELQMHLFHDHGIPVVSPEMKKESRRLARLNDPNPHESQAASGQASYLKSSPRKEPPPEQPPPKQPPPNTTDEPMVCPICMEQLINIMGLQMHLCHDHRIYEITPDLQKESRRLALLLSESSKHESPATDQPPQQH